MGERSMERRKDLSSQISLLLILISFSLYPLGAAAQDFPHKPIVLYCGQEAGATTDLTSRALAKGAEKELGVPVVVENKPGGGFTVAATLLANKKPDGYTLGIISSAAFETRHIILKVSYDPFKDFTYIFTYSTYPGGICVRADSPFKTLRDLIEHARKNPRTLSYSSAGTGGKPHLSVEFLAKQTNVKFKHVPFKGGAPACTALIGGHVDFTAGSGIHLNYVQQGILRLLAVLNSEEREPQFPQIPTLIDLGYKDIPPSYLTLTAPKGLPDPVFKKIESAFRTVAHSPEFRKVLENYSMPFVFRDRRQFEAILSKDSPFYKNILQEFQMIK